MYHSVTCKVGFLSIHPARWFQNPRARDHYNLSVISLSTEPRKSIHDRYTLEWCSEEDQQNSLGTQG